MTRWTVFCAAAAASVLVPADADAMCGCMMRTRPTEHTALTNKASVVVMMREGTRTVLSFSNDYFGPAEDFALLVPVPVVLREGEVRTLDRGLFDRVQAVAAPHLVELFEEPACPVSMGHGRSAGMSAASAADDSSGRAGQVVVEAQFAEGEYDITILGANDSSALEQWLRANGFHLPPTAESVLRPYVQSGMKFFVARVDVERLRRIAAARTGAQGWMDESMQELLEGPPAEGGDARLGRFLSPLRIHYDSDELSLPVRLGLLNSTGEQDLVVHVLAPGQRYEAANYDNATVPTNVRVHPAAAGAFGRFYDAFFARLSARARRRVFTEFAGPVQPPQPRHDCVGCRWRGLASADLDALGDTLLPGRTDTNVRERRRSYVLTRMHYRYGRAGLPDDLVFRAAPPIAGGSESAGEPRLPRAARSAAANDFRVRFLVQHRWPGRATCARPERGRFSDRPFDFAAPRLPRWPRRRPIPLEQWVRDPVPGLGLRRR